MDPLTKAYLKVIEENAEAGTADTNLQIGATFGHKENEKNAKTFVKKSGSDDVDSELEEPEDAPAEYNSNSSESKAKELKKVEKLTLKDSVNPFDALFNKIISEEDSFNFDTEDNSLTPDSDFGGPEGIGAHGAEDEYEDGDEDYEVSDEEEQEDVDHESMEGILSQIKDLVAKLEDKLSEHEEHQEEEESEEGEEGEDEDESHDEYDDDLDSSDEEDHDSLNEEEVDAEILGHALVDQEKLEAGQTKKSVFTVKGAVPVTKKKATVVKGKKVTGKPENHSTEPAVNSLTSKSSINVGGVQVGKDLYDQN